MCAFPGLGTNQHLQQALTRLLQTRRCRFSCRPTQKRNRRKNESRHDRVNHIVLETPGRLWPIQLHSFHLQHGRRRDGRLRIVNLAVLLLQDDAGAVVVRREVVRCSPSDKSAHVPRVHQVGPPSTRVAAVAGLHKEELHVAQRDCKTKLVFRQECTEQNTAQAEETAMCPANKLSAVCLAPSQCRF